MKLIKRDKFRDICYFFILFYLLINWEICKQLIMGLFICKSLNWITERKEISEICAGSDAL